MNTTLYLTVKIAWVVGKILMQYVNARQAVLTPEEREEWNRDWAQDFEVGEGEGTFRGPGIVLKDAIEPWKHTDQKVGE